MKAKHPKMTLAALAAAGVAPSAFGQDTTLLIEHLPYITVGQFFIALITGLLLAIGFQIVLSALTTAIGFSSLPNMVKRAEKPPYPIGKKHSERAEAGKERKERKEREEREEQEKSDSDDNGPSFPLTKITSAFGIWTLITASISLFFACWLAIALGVIAAPVAAIVLGLVIWATFFTLAAILEIKSITTLVGSLTSAVGTGIRASVGAISSLGSKSPEQKLQEVADHTIDKVTHDLGRSFRENDFHGKISDYIDQMSPSKGIDFERMRDEIEDLINDIEVEENFTFEDDEAKRHLVLKVLSDQSRFSKKDLGKAKSVFSKAKAIKDQEGSPSEKAKSAFDKFSPGDEEQGRGWRQRFENYLSKTDRDELDPDAVSEDIDRIVNEPGQSWEVVQNRLAQMDRNTAKGILAARDDIDEERAEKIVSTVEKAVNRIKSQFGSAKSETQSMVAEGQSRGADVKDKAKSAVERAKGIPAKIQARVEKSVKDYLSRVDQPELSYASLSRDFEKIMDNPKEAPSVLKERLQELDRESVVSALAARENTSREEAERIADKAIEARDSLMKRLHKIELAAKEKYYQSRYMLLKELEHLRRTGASAAWWLLGTAVISAAAAAAGALTGLALL